MPLIATREPVALSTVKIRKAYCRETTIDLFSLVKARAVARPSQMATACIGSLQTMQRYLFPTATSRIYLTQTYCIAIMKERTSWIC